MIFASIYTNTFVLFTFFDMNMVFLHLYTVPLIPLSLKNAVYLSRSVLNTEYCISIRIAL